MLYINKNLKTIFTEMAAAKTENDIFEVALKLDRLYENNCINDDDYMLLMMVADKIEKYIWAVDKGFNVAE